MKTIGIILALAALAACGERRTVSTSQTEPQEDLSALNEMQVQKIEVPNEKLALKFKSITLSNNSKAQKIKLSKTITVEIPEHAFVDQNGKAVEGDVQLKYREMLNSLDILCSGIPMKYDSAGSDLQLESAGMFELTAFNNKGEEVYIKDGKVLDVSMKTKPVKDFNWYYFDKTTGQWNYLQSANAEKSDRNRGQRSTAESDRVSTSSKPTTEVIPSPYKNGEPVLDLQIRSSEYPELNHYESLVWQFADKESKRKAAALDKEMMENYGMNTITRKNDYDNKFVLTVNNGSDQTVLEIIPVVQKEDYEKIKQINQILAKSNQDDGVVASMNQTVMRKFGISTFGVYNCDRIFTSESIQLQAQFHIKGESDKNKTVEKVYVVLGSANTVYKYTKDQFHSIRFMKNDPQMIVGIMNDGSTAVMGAEEVKSKLKGKNKTVYMSLTRISNEELGISALKQNM